MTRMVRGYRYWEGDRDDDGHRTYQLGVLVQVGILDGPAVALQMPGLPRYGSYWLIGNDIDVWAFCKQGTKVKQVTKNEGNEFFELEYTFTTKPDKKWCVEHQQDDPLLVPQKISGGFTKYQEEATHDRFGNPIVNSAWEALRGQQVEFDAHRATVKIEQNVPDLQYNLCKSLLDCVNDAPLWGLPERCWKCSSFTWEKKYYGICYAYYTRTFEFDANTKVLLDPALIAAGLTGQIVSGWDKDLLDAGHKCINGHWVTDSLGIHWQKDPLGTAPAPNPDPMNPSHFIHAKDPNNENIELVLDGRGAPIDTNNLVLSGKSGTITAVTYNATKPTGQTQCTSVGHGLSTGDTVIVTNAVGCTSINGIHAVAVGTAGFDVPSLGIHPHTDPDTFYLLGVDPNAALTGTCNWAIVLRKSTTIGSIHVEKYQAGNLLLLNIPTQI